MICFKDMTYCADGGECKNYSCKRHWSDDLELEAEKWMKDPPIAWAHYKDVCGKFVHIDRGAE